MYDKNPGNAPEPFSFMVGVALIASACLGMFTLGAALAWVLLIIFRAVL